MQVSDSQNTGLLNSTSNRGDETGDISNASVEEITKEAAVSKFADAVAAANDGGHIVPREESEVVRLPDGPPKGMPAVGHTTDFPRADNLYRKKESLPYDEC
jgi:hypothetical protein